MEHAMLDFNCRHCAKHIVHGPNAWYRIGNSSVTAADPEAMDEATNAYKVEEKEFTGSGELENCTLIKLLCGNCKKRLGLRCVQSHAAGKSGYVGRNIFRMRDLQAKVRGSTEESAFQFVVGSPATLDAPKSTSTKDTQQLTDRSVTLQQSSKGSRVVATQPESSQAFVASTAKENDLMAAVEDNRRTIAGLTSIVNELRDEFNAFKKAHSQCVPSSVNEDVVMSGTIDSLHHSDMPPIQGPKSMRTSTLIQKPESPCISDSSVSTGMRSTLTEPEKRHGPAIFEDPLPTTDTFNGVASHRKPGTGTIPEPSNPSVTEDTQQYLEKTTRDYDPKDSDWAPHTASYNTPGPHTTKLDSSTSTNNTTTLPSLRDIMPVHSNPRDTFAAQLLQTSEVSSYNQTRHGGRRSPTPEWERPDWDPQKHANGYKFGLNNYTTSARGQSIRRRGVSSSSAALLSTPTHNQKRMRDADGYLLLPNGKRDGRSVRHARDDLRAVVAPDGRMKHQLINYDGAIDPRSIPGQRDADGFLLRPNGKRDRRSGKGAILRRDKQERDVLRNVNNTAITTTPSSTTPENYHTPGNENSNVWTPVNGGTAQDELPSSQRTVIKAELPIPAGHSSVMSRIFPHRENQ